jgi:hypothetical protein
MILLVPMLSSPFRPNPDPFSRSTPLSTGRSSLSLLQCLFLVLLFELHNRDRVSFVKASRRKAPALSLTLFCSSGLNKARRLSSARRLASRFSSSVSPVSSCTSRWYSFANSWSTSARIFLNFRVVFERYESAAADAANLQDVPRV